MENHKLSPEEVFNNKKLFSNKIHARVLKVTEEISTSFEKLTIVNDVEKKLFLTAVNHYYEDLCAVIFHLRKVVITIDGDDQGNRDLKDVITELNKIALSVQDCLNLETETLKIQLKGTVVDVGSQVEKLMKIVKYDNLHEQKQKILDCQHDLVISVEALKLYNQLAYLSMFEFTNLIHEMIEKTKHSLMEIKSGHELREEDFSHYTRHSVQHLQKLLDYMRKMNNIENFPNDVTNVFKNAEVFGIDYISDMLEAVRYDNPMNKMLDIIENCHKNVAKSSTELQNVFQSASETNIVDDRVTHLMVYLLIHGLNAMSALNQSIIDAIMKK